MIPVIPPTTTTTWLRPCFRRYNSTETILIKITNNLLTQDVSVPSFSSISVLLLTVSHPILLNNMYTVSTSASTSTPASVCQGTPQGSVLRPLCFYIFTCTCSPFILLFMLMHCCPLVGSKCFQTENCICETTNKCNQREKEM